MAPDVTPHEISLAVWDLASPLVVNRSSKMKVGARCSGGCQLTDQKIEIRDVMEVTVGSGKLGLTPWPETAALYWTELDLAVPAKEGMNSWSVTLTPSNLELPHERASSHFSFITVPPSEHTVTVKVIEKSTEAPVDDVEVRFGVYRASTDKFGLAKVGLPKGAFELAAWKLGYDAVTKNVKVTADVTIQVEIEILPEPVQEYWMG